MEPLPPKVFYPQARLSMVIRFEEFDAKDTPPVPDKPPQLRKGTGDPVLDVVKREAFSGVEVLKLEAKNKTASGPAATERTSTDLRTHHIDGVIPKTASLCRNGIRVADTLKVTLALADFPFDPRLVRACGVEFYMGTVPAKVFAAAVQGRARGDRDPELFMLDDVWIDQQNRPRSNLRFQGWVDDWSLEMSEEGDPVVALECTDQTRLLIDQHAPPKLVIGDTKPLDEAIADYLANFPKFQGFVVEYRPKNPINAEASPPPPTLKSAFAVTAYKPAGMGPPAAAGGGSKLAVWDYITDVCGAIGHIVFVETIMLANGDAVPAIVIQRPMTLYGDAFKRPGDIFSGRILPSGRELPRRTFTYGANAKRLQFGRKFSKYDPTNIEVRCYSPAQGKTLVVRYPDAKDKRQKSLLTGNVADQKWEVVRVQGIEDEATLRVIAQGVYEQKMRCELSAHVHTTDLASLGGTNLDPDVLDIMAGDAITVEVDRDAGGVSTIANIENFKAQDAAGWLIELGYSAALAQAYAKAASNIYFPTTFRVRACTVEWRCDEAPEIDIELINYMEVRATSELPEGEEVEPPPEPTQPAELVVLGEYE